MGYSRQIFALARAGFMPAALARVHPRFRTPHIATLAGGAVGIVAIYSDSLVTIAGQSLTASIVTMAVFGALVMYGMSMASCFGSAAASRTSPGPTGAVYPFAPRFALALAAVCFLALVITNPLIFTSSSP